MIELPEGYVLARQIQSVLIGKQIKNVIPNQNPHKFAWFSGDPAEYPAKLTGRTITAANDGAGYTCGGNVEIVAEDMLVVASTPIRYHLPGQELPPRHQLLLEFEDRSALSFTVQMWGAMLCFSKDKPEFPKMLVIRQSPNPLIDAFDRVYFNELLQSCPEKYSLKAFLATEQRIPGLGNGVLQDILFNAALHPKKKIASLTPDQVETLFDSLKITLRQMADQGGRDTEKDLFGNTGGYKTLLSSKTVNDPCPNCGGPITKEAYLGGSVYYCPACQTL
jgi:formamidopyrimidine-DNA glycosylase